MTDPLAQGFLVVGVMRRILDAGALIALLAVLFMIFLALVRHRRLDVPWARRIFLDPVDAARAKRAAEEELEQDRLQAAQDAAAGRPTEKSE